MSGEPLMTIVGNATGDAELRFLPNGTGVASFTVAVTPRVKRGDAWVDGDTTFFRCSAWRDMAEHCAETITKGMRVIVYGRFKARQYEKDGQSRTSIEIEVDEVAPSLRYATAKVQKAQRSGGQQAASGSNDPWSDGPTRASDFASEPPF